jgi:hypothetical protein
LNIFSENIKHDEQRNRKLQKLPVKLVHYGISEHQNYSLSQPFMKANISFYEDTYLPRKNAEYYLKGKTMNIPHIGYYLSFSLASVTRNNKG